MKEAEVARLLSEGIAPAEVVRRGYNRSTVYKVNKRLQQPSAPNNEDGAKAITDSGLDPVLEADPEIMELRKAIRRAELEQQLADLKAPTRFEPRLVTIEKTAASITKAVEGMLEDLEDLEQQVEGSPFSGLREEFRCECGAKGFVQARVCCTACGQEAGYGWWPQESG